MNLKTLTEQRADKQNEMETLLNKVEGEQRAFTDEENELIRLRKENKQVLMENDILKQAALIMARK